MRTARTLFVVCLCLPSVACKTMRQKDDTVVVAVEAAPESGLGPAPPSPIDETLSADPARGVAEPSALAAALPPVRGGARVLPPYRGPEPCQMALTGESPVAKACSARGLRGATELMQLFVRRAKAEGISFVCTDCHVDEDDYMSLRPRADGEFRKLLFLARPED